MNTLRIDDAPAHTDIVWTPFPGGELEGQRPRAQCPSCRSRARGEEGQGAAAVPPTKPALCFQCYRTEMEKNRKIKAAAELDTASEARFQAALPFEPVDAPRLQRLKAERQVAREQAREGAGLYVERRRKAQIEARHTLARIIQGLRERRMVDLPAAKAPGAQVAPAGAVALASGLELPESWLPFVAAR